MSAQRHGYGKLSLLLLVIIIFTSLSGCAPGNSFDKSLNEIASPYTFNLASWEFSALKTVFNGSVGPESGSAEVSEYFNTIEQIRSMDNKVEQTNLSRKQNYAVASELQTQQTQLTQLKQRSADLTATVETVLEKQVTEVLREQGIFNPLDQYLSLAVGFPPFNFKLDNPPHLLVISPRDRIDSLRTILLQQGLDTEDMEAIEAGASGLNVSALVVELGGFAAYPSFVSNSGGLRFTISAAVEEWLHQYLAFRPLGFRYLLDLTGIKSNYEIVTMNETVASMVSDEIGDIVYRKYYTQFDKATTPTNPVSRFDFNKEMREIRKAVDAYLARGEIDQAEAFMNVKRQYLEDNGYYIRKLNQAYFAFNGAYAAGPTSIDPIGAGFRELRARSSSLKSFLEVASAMTGRQDLTQALQ